MVVDGNCERDRLDLQPLQERMVRVALHERPPERVEQHDRELLALGGERLDLGGEISERRA